MDILLIVILPGAAAAFALAFGGRRDWPQRLDQALYVLAWFAALAALARFLLAVISWLPPDSPVNSYDFGVFYRAAIAARTWAPLYDLAEIQRDPGVIVVYRHAPLGAGLFIPLTLLPYTVALNTWRLLNVGLYLLTLWALLRHLGVRLRDPLSLGLIGLWCLSTPSRDSLALGQWDTIFLALTAWAMVALTVHPRRDLLAGILLAPAIVLKFYPGLLLLDPLLRRRWKLLFGCALAGIALIIAGTLLAGPANTWIFLTEVLPAVGGGTLYAENQTLYAFFGRLLATDLPGNGVGATYPQDLTRALVLLCAAILLPLTVIALRRRSGGLDREQLRFVTPIPLALLLIPTAWAHYAALALLPLTLLAVLLARDEPSWLLIGLFVVAALLIPLGSERDVWRDNATHDGPVRLLLTYKVYGLVSLWLALVLACWGTRWSRWRRQSPRSSLLFGRTTR